VPQTVFEAGYVDEAHTIVHACRRSLKGWVALCGQTPAWTVGRFDSSDERACPECVRGLGSSR
jgi:hypothetical protein